VSSNPTGLQVYEVLCSFHDELQTELMSELEALGELVSADQLTELLLGVYKKIEGSFLYKLITSAVLM